MDERVHYSPEVRLLAQKINLPARCQRFGITELTRQNLAVALPILVEHLNGLSTRFYEFLRHFPEVEKIFRNHDREMLRHNLQKHWVRVLQAEYDEDYLLSSLMIGHAHYKAHVPPHLYMAGYNYFLSSFLQIVAAEHYGGEFAAATGTISKVIMFDMSNSLTAFMVSALHSDERE